MKEISEKIKKICVFKPTHLNENVKLASNIVKRISLYNFFMFFLPFKKKTEIYKPLPCTFCMVVENWIKKKIKNFHSYPKKQKMYSLCVLIALKIVYGWVCGLVMEIFDGLTLISLISLKWV